MATTIGELDYKIIADTEQFEKATKVSQQEIREMNKAVRETRTPLERYQHELDKLNNLRRKGLISAEQYQRAIKKEKLAYEQATASTKRYTASLTSMSAALRNAAAAYISFVAVSGIARNIAEMDESIKRARQLGLTVNELIGLQTAADRMSGMEARQVNTALQRMTRRLSEAASGAGEAKDAIEELGLSAVELERAGPMQAFLAIADAINMVENQADRVRLAFKLFDSEGALLVTTLQEGSAAIQEQAERAEELGLTINRSTDEIEAANDALSDLSDAWSGVGRTITLEVLGPLQESTQFLTRLGRGAQRIARTFRIGAALRRGEDPAALINRFNGGEQEANKVDQAARQQATEVGRIQADAAREAARVGEELEQMRQANIAEEQKTQEAAIKNARLRIDALQGLFDGIQVDTKKLASPQSFQSGSREEYQWRVMQQRQQQQAQEDKRANRQAENQRRQIIEELNGAREHLRMLESKAQTVEGVG